MAESVTNEEIRAIALANGFSLREQPDGSMDLNPYVYAFARALRKEVLSEIRPLVADLTTIPRGATRHIVAVDRLRELVREGE